MLPYIFSGAPSKDIQAPGEASGPTENSSTKKIFLFSFFWGEFLPNYGSGSTDPSESGSNLNPNPKYW
jgi:hypothetical protein